MNEEDEEIGVIDKMQAHEQGLLHRAFSIFIFNSKGEMLLQQRADGKYHSAGLWTNACCSHPAPGESLEAAAHRRLLEELGFDCKLRKVFSFRYKTQFENGLIEHEFDHVFVGTYDEELRPDPDEVKASEYLSLDAIAEKIKREPQMFTFWFRLALPQLKHHLRN